MDVVVGVAEHKKLITLTVLIITILIFTILMNFQEEKFEQKRLRILNELSLAIKEAKLQGNYICFIEPPCTMCYLGEWIWENGSCYCDDMIIKGEFDKVCPQCKKGIEEGKCKLSEGACNTVLK